MLSQSNPEKALREELSKVTILWGHFLSSCRAAQAGSYPSHARRLPARLGNANNNEPAVSALRPKIAVGTSWADEVDEDGAFPSAGYVFGPPNKSEKERRSVARIPRIGFVQISLRLDVAGHVAPIADLALLQHNRARQLRLAGSLACQFLCMSCRARACGRDQRPLPYRLRNHCECDECHKAPVRATVPWMPVRTCDPCLPSPCGVFLQACCETLLSARLSGGLEGLRRAI